MRDVADRLSILLVEDNAGDARLVQEHLRQSGGGFDTEHVSRLDAAMDALYHRAFDLVLLDLSLPDSAGLRSLTKLRESTPGIPVVVLTGLDDDQTGIAAVQAGAQDYLVKGEITPRSLARALRYAMERSASTREAMRFQQQYSLWIRQSGDGLWDWDLQRNRIAYSPGWVAALGLSPHQVEDVPDVWFDRVHPDDAESLANTIDEHLESEDPTFRLEHRLRDSDGRWRWYEARALVLRDVAGRATRIAGSLRDISAQRRGRCVACAAVNDPRSARCVSCGAELPAHEVSSDRLRGNELSLGTMLDGRYRVAQLIAVGSSAAVYEAFDTDRGVAVALKILHGWLVDDDASVDRFMNEGKLQRDLVSPHIVRVYDVIGAREGVLHVMEFVRGQTLRDWLLSVDATGEPEPVLALLAPILDALALVHASGVVHRDIKPENILVTGIGRARIAKLADFGIAKVGDLPSRTRTGSAMGTLHYMAPEQFADAKEVDARADLYALGCTIFEALTRRTPYDGSSDFQLMTSHLNAPPASARALNPLVSPALDAVLQRAMAKAAEDRWPSAEAFALALRRAVPWEP